MGPRERRLIRDNEEMNLLVDERIAFSCEGNPPERYEITFSTPGIYLNAGRLETRQSHQASIYLHKDYPRRPPVVAWATPVFHPNLLGPDRNGGVCIGSWAGGEGLADLCVRLADLVSYRSFNTADALNPEAADWALAHAVAQGADVASLTGLELVAEPVIKRAGFA